MRGILFDLDGVFYTGDTAIPGGADVLAWVREQGIPHLFLTNTTSRPRVALVEKLAAYGIETTPEHILTPPVAARQWLSQNVRGPVALFVAAATEAEFDGLPTLPRDSHATAAAVVIGDLGEGWDFATLNAAFHHLGAEPEPALVALGMTRYWRNGTALQLDVGPFVEALRYASGVQPVVLGKPARAFFDAALDVLGLPADEVLMVGDDIIGDIGGAASAGIAGLQVRTGKFRPSDLVGHVTPVGVIDSIAALPAWWERRRLSGA